MSNELKIKRANLSEMKRPKAQTTQLKVGEIDEPAASNDDESTPTPTPTPTTPTTPTATADSNF
jgi:hypothetical protein